MDLDLHFISAILRSPGSFALAKKKTITDQKIEGPSRDGWKFISDHVIEHGSVPSVDFFQAKTGIQTIEPQEKIEVLIKDVNDRFLWNKIRTSNEDVVKAINESKPHDALKVYETVVRESYKECLIGTSVESLWGIGPEVLNLYERVKNGDRGIPTPWEAMNEMTLGWWGGEFIIFVARLGIGKTFTLLLLARNAWMNGKSVLFVGTEMSRLKLAMRLYSIHLHLPYRDFRHGRLSSFKEQELKDKVAELSAQEGFNIVGSDFESRIEDIEAAIEAHNPDILFVDGIYLIKNAGKDRHAIVSNTANDLKRMSIRKNIPIVASHQFNREVTANSRSNVLVENLGVTDVLGWNADCAFGMYQTDDMKEDRIMGFRPMKLREGTGQDFFAQWDFDSMTFDQLVVEEDIRPDTKDAGLDNVPGTTVGDGWGDDGTKMLF